MITSGSGRFTGAGTQAEKLPVSTFSPALSRKNISTSLLGVWRTTVDLHLQRFWRCAVKLYTNYDKECPLYKYPLEVHSM
jgi:hypothetical protein